MSLSPLEYRLSGETSRDYRLLSADRVNRLESSGLVASSGLIVLTALGVSNPVWLHRRFPGLAEAARLTLAILVFALMGAASEMVALHVTQLFRAYNRISMFVLFLALLAVGLLVQGLLKSQRGLRSQLLLLGLTGLALLDQVPTASSPEYAKDRSAFETDHAFVQQMESSVTPGSAIFQFPVVWYPAFGDLYQVEDHDHLRGYLHGKKLRWSYGAVPRRSTYRWQQEVAALPVPEMVLRLSDAGFSGIYINTLGYKDRGRMLLEQLRRYQGAEPLVGGAKGELRFFQLPLPPANVEKRPGGHVSRDSGGRRHLPANRSKRETEIEWRGDPALFRSTPGGRACSSSCLD